MRIVSVAQMKELERQADAGGYGYEKMMARAGKELAGVIHVRFGAEFRTVLGLVGSGNNGGDTLIALTHLIKAGWSAKAWLVKEREKNDPALAAFLAAGGQLASITEDLGFKQLIELG